MNDIQALGEIDFLPRRYRDAKAKRHANVWRLIVAVMFAVMLVTATYMQQRLLWATQADLAKVNAMHAAASAVAAELAAEQAKIPAADQQAALLTFLRHPWPRTQILHAILKPVPDAVQITELSLAFELPEKPVQEHLQAAKDDGVDKTPSPARNLKRLREELDGGQYVVALSGTTTDVAELHAYLANLEQAPLFSKVKLVAIETPQSTQEPRSQFSARLILRPGYGQPGGPDATSPSHAKLAMAKGAQ